MSTAPVREIGTRPGPDAAALPPLRLGTRRSRLATSQSQAVADAIAAATGRVVELVTVTTTGDVDRRSLSQIGGTGVFVSALRDALLRGDVDLAVHSLKDIPTAPEPGLVLAAVPEREDPRDALVARDGLTLGELPEGAVVGTGSPRRAAQLRALGLGLQVQDLRGNVETRLATVTDGKVDAVVLARAGLNRLGLADVVTEDLDPLQVLPAPGQGALAVECRADDETTRAACAVLDDPVTRACVDAERALLRELEAGCTAPVGALAVVAEGEDGDEVYLRGVVASPDGVDLRRSATGPVAGAADLGRRLARLMLEDGAADLMSAAAAAPPGPAGPPGANGAEPAEPGERPPAGAPAPHDAGQDLPNAPTGGHPAAQESEQ
ncbi:hydroxymethylbilane synthase [Thalassiella azotivora]